MLCFMECYKNYLPANVKDNGTSIFSLSDDKVPNLLRIIYGTSFRANWAEGKGSFNSWRQSAETFKILPDVSMSFQRILSKNCPIIQQSILLHTGPGHALQIWFLLDFLLSDEIGFESLGHLSCTIFKVFSRLRYASPLENL